jgi:hypothetical protein
MSSARRAALFVLFAVMLGCSTRTEKTPDTVTSEEPTTAVERPDDPRARRYHHQFSPAVKMVLDQADSLELSSLEPDLKTENWTVLGKTQITDAATRKRIVAALEKGMENAETGAKCFYPRHAVSASYGGNRVDLVICFECGWLSVSPSNGRSMVEFTSREQPLLDGILTAAGVPLAKKREDAP